MRTILILILIQGRRGDRNGSSVSINQEQTACFEKTALAVAIVAIIAFIVMFRERYIEYDYCFYNEEIEIAKIMNRKRRRTAIQFEMNNIRLIAPEGSIRLANERERYPQMRYTDYTSVEPTSPVYGFVLDLKGVSTTIMLEPTESMMDHLRQLVPNKIYED